jgi:23S rRNA-/tRNA-specific pseudouridylate synthase
MRLKSLRRSRTIREIAARMIAVHDQRAAASLKARPATSTVTPIRQINDFTLLEVLPNTGRRHHIRVHLADAGFPIAGDEIYGGPRMPSLAPGRFFLHLSELRIPMAGGNENAQAVSAREPLVVVASIPDDLRRCIEL